jgi:hypothetical protein
MQTGIVERITEHESLPKEDVPGIFLYSLLDAKANLEVSALHSFFNFKPPRSI